MVDLASQDTFFGCSDWPIGDQTGVRAVTFIRTMNALAHTFLYPPMPLNEFNILGALEYGRVGTLRIQIPSAPNFPSGKTLRSYRSDRILVVAWCQPSETL